MRWVAPGSYPQDSEVRVFRGGVLRWVPRICRLRGHSMQALTKKGTLPATIMNIVLYIPVPFFLCQAASLPFFGNSHRNLKFFFFVFFRRAREHLLAARLLSSCDGIQEVDGDMFPILNARLGAGGRYRAYPPRVPVERSYFTLMFVNVGTVTVLDSAREVRVCAETETEHHFITPKNKLLNTQPVRHRKQEGGGNKL